MATIFDPNRVEPGTFKLVRDASTGTYSIQEVGFTKLPSLTLPDLSPTTTTTTTTQTQDQTKTDTTDVTQPILPQVGVDRDDRQNISATTMLKDPSDQLTQAAQVSKSLDSGFLDSGAAGGTSLRDTGSVNIVDEVALTGRQVDENRIDRGNPTGDPRIVSEEQGLVGSSPRIPDRIMQRTSEIGALPFTRDPISQENIALSKDKNVIDKARNLINNSATVKLITAGSQAVGSMLKSAGKAILGPETNSQVHARGYFNIAGTSSQPQRIAGNPATELYAGANANARDLDAVGQKRIDMIEKNLAAGKYRDPEKQRQKLEKFKQDQKDYRESRNEDMRDREQAALSDKTKSVDYGITGGATRTDIDVGDGGSESSSGGKIVCTMMNESYGFGSFRNKIWMKFHKDLSPEYQKGYHKLFLPLIKIAKTNKIVKNILEHIAVHSTIDMRQSMRGKKHLLGRLYRKILLPLCYWVGKI